MNALSRAARSSLLLWRTSPGLALTPSSPWRWASASRRRCSASCMGRHGRCRCPTVDEIVAMQKLAVRADVDASTRPYDVRRWSEQARSFEAIGAFESLAMTLATESGGPGTSAGDAYHAQPVHDRGAAGLVGRRAAARRRSARGDAGRGARTRRLADALRRRRRGGRPHDPPRRHAARRRRRHAAAIRIPDQSGPVGAARADRSGAALARARGCRRSAGSARTSCPRAAQAELDTLSREGATPDVRVEVLPFRTSKRRAR